MNFLADFVEHVLRPLWVLWMMIVFLGIVFWAYRPKNKDRFQSYGDIPFRNDDKER